MNKKEITAKKNTQKNNLSIQDRLMEKFNLIRKHLGQDIFEKLNELYLSYKILFVDKYLRGNNDSLNLKTCKNLINHSENYIYKIKVGNKEAIGFFCKIPFPNKDNILSVLITNNNILNEELLNKKDKKIKIIRNIKEEKIINLSNRRKYISKEYNITIIEIKKKDEIYNYLELDERIINDILNIEKINDENNDFSIFYLQKLLYMIGNSKIIYGAFLDSQKDKKCFSFHCNKKDYQLGIPIFSRKSKLVGFFNSYENNNKKTIGICIFLNYPIKEFIKTNYKYKSKDKVDIGKFSIK